VGGEYLSDGIKIGKQQAFFIDARKNDEREKKLFFRAKEET